MTHNSLAEERLKQERITFRKTHPFGFIAKPDARPDGSTDIFTWKCVIPGKDDTAWEGGKFPVTLVFPKDYPSMPPKAYFPRGFLHPNVYPEGLVCLSILNGDPEMGGQWAPAITVGQILQGMQALLDDPNLSSAAQEKAYSLFNANRDKYHQEVRKQALRYQDRENDL